MIHNTGVRPRIVAFVTMFALGWVATARPAAAQRVHASEAVVPFSWLPAARTRQPSPAPDTACGQRSYWLPGALIGALLIGGAASTICDYDGAHGSLGCHLKVGVMVGGSLGASIGALIGGQLKVPPSP